ncbi:dehydrogenase, partial [Acidianus sp. DSM 29099]|nr:dehydrogenase [Acidianus sp. RZ1]
AATFLEKEDVVYSYWHNYLVYNSPIRKKKGLTEIELMREIAKRLKISDEVIWEDEWNAISKSTGIDSERLKKDKIIKLDRKIEGNKVKVLPLPQKLERCENVLIFSSHPNFTNSQFREIYKGEAKVFNSRFEGVGYMYNEFGKVRVHFVKDERIPEGVYFMYKSHLFDLDGKPINCLEGPRKGKLSGTPPLNSCEIKVEIDQKSTS